ncbi:hypothetical protein CPC16_000281 [Podila verticillata]|nr:hypothetical protein CPC16_000281 [Podila verticillata]
MLKGSELPEIVLRVGYYVPTFKPNVFGVLDFEPADLIACIKVCRLWRITLTPLLWMFYDSDAMGYYNIPNAILELRSVHFRYLALSYGHRQLPIRSTQLQKVVFRDYRHRQKSLKLLTRNPQIKELAWIAPNESEGPWRMSPIYAALESLAQLTHLTLDYWNEFETEQLVKMASKMPQLESLTLAHFERLEETTSTLPTLNVTTLVIDSSWDLNSGLIQLIRACPRLTSITIPADSYCPAVRIADALRECCPNVTAIKCFDGSSVHTEQRALRSPSILALLGCVTRLVHFDFPITTFTKQICDALLVHAQSLETVRLQVIGIKEDNFTNSNRILSSCPNIAHFSFENAYNMWKQEVACSMFKEKWNCPKLKHFEMSGFQSSGGDDDGEGSEFDSERDYAYDEEGSSYDDLPFLSFDDVEEDYEGYDSEGGQPYDDDDDDVQGEYEYDDEDGAVNQCDDHGDGDDENQREDENGSEDEDEDKNKEQDDQCNDLPKAEQVKAGEIEGSGDGEHQGKAENKDSNSVPERIEVDELDKVDEGDMENRDLVFILKYLRTLGWHRKGNISLRMLSREYEPLFVVFRYTLTNLLHISTMESVHLGRWFAFEKTDRSIVPEECNMFLMGPQGK